MSFVKLFLIYIFFFSITNVTKNSLNARMEGKTAICQLSNKTPKTDQ